MRSSGAKPPADRRTSLSLVPCGQCRRGPAAAAPGARDGPPPARLAGRDLDDNVHGAGGRSPDLSRPGDFLCPARLQLVDAPRDGRVRPTVLALVELELWPNLIRAAKATGCQGGDHQRPSQLRELSWLPQLSSPLRPTLSDRRRGRPGRGLRRRFVELGVPGDRVSVTGSVKYDGLESDRNNAKTRELREELGLAPTDLVFVAGSTMEGEEAAALAAYRRLGASIPACG